MQITLTNVDALQAQALARLTLLVMGQTHRLFGEYQDWLVGQVSRQVDSEGMVNGAALLTGFSVIADRYRRTVGQWAAMFEQARVQAASIPFGALVVKHNSYMGSLTEDLNAQDINTVTRLWQQRRQRALQAAQGRVYGDGLQLSQRIWRLEADGLQRIRSTLATALAERTSAADLADRLEPILGADQDMTRWTQSRLYGMTPSERAESDKGLLTGAETRAKGIAYNALRLARTELQNANHAVATEIAKHSPWITGRYVRLSPGHPHIDVCDDWSSGGPYPKEQQILPLHPNCVTPGQLVSTDRGAIPIEQVRAGDKVLTHRGRYKRVKAAWSNPHDDLAYEFDTPCGRFEVTGNHPVLLRRGWVNAEFVKPGDEVLYALTCISGDSFTGVSENQPAVFLKPAVALQIAGRVTFMPSLAVAFHRDLNINQGEVDTVTSDLVFALKSNPGLRQGVHHDGFDGSRVGDALLPARQQHRHQAGIAFEFGEGDFFTDIFPFGYVPRSRLSAESNSVLFLSVDDRLTSVAHGDAGGIQEIPQRVVRNFVANTNNVGGQSLRDIDILQEIRGGFIEFLFDAQSMESGASQPVADEVRAARSLHAQAANGASNHDSVLSLNPDVHWGAESGNSGVNGVANPIQALGDYTIVTSVKQRHYTGLVYNMEVEEDHSYTVNGAAVHNCLCYYEEQVMSAGVFKSQVADWLAGESDFLDDYRDWLGIQQVTEPLPTNMNIAESLNLWLSTGRGAQVAALNLN